MDKPICSQFQQLFDCFIEQMQINLTNVADKDYPAARSIHKNNFQEGRFDTVCISVKSI